MTHLVVSVIIVSFNVRDELRRCLTSLRGEPISLEVFVVDNASEDGTREMLEQDFGGWSALKAIYNRENVGLARANNQPMEMCSGQYVLICNPDIISREGAITGMASYLDSHPDVGVVGPKQLFENGSPHLTYQTSWGVVHPILWAILPYRLVRRFSDKIANYHDERDVLFVSGSCLMIRRELFVELRGYDENFFLSLEDVADLCLRVRQNGYRVVYYPTAEVVHLVGRSVSHDRSFALLMRYQGDMYYQRKHSGRIAALILRVVFFVSSLWKALITGLLGIFDRRFRAPFKMHSYAAVRLLTLAIPIPPRQEDYELRS